MATASGSDNGTGSAQRGALFGHHEPRQYNEAEQRFSRFIQERMEKLLKGELNQLPVLRRYHQDPARLGAPVPEHGLDRRSLRLPVVEELLTSILTFLQADLPGGPITQESVDGRLVERQLFPTRLPHVIIERVDRYDSASNQSLETEWTIRRIQNQHAENRVLRMLDFANIGLGIQGFLRTAN
jgi:hypothetical protein